MAEMIVLEANKREMAGKQVRKLRHAGIIPGVLYGPTFEAIPLQIEWTKLRPTLRQAGASQIIELHIDGETYNALVRDVQRAPLKGDVLHVDFYRVRMDVTIRTDVPINMVGSDEPMESIGGVIIQEMTTIEVECLPTDLPPEIQIDISDMTEIGEMRMVSDLPKPDRVTFMANDDDVVISSSYLERLVEEEEEELEEELFGELEEPELVGREEEEEIEDGEDEEEV
jgi:large subunit ribosomal protein L25